MPALITNNASRTKSRGTHAGALKARHNGEHWRAPAVPEADASPMVLKAVRELEHGRQRSKKVADTERMRERKRRGGTARLTHAGYAAARKINALDAEKAEAEDAEVDDRESCALGASQAEVGEHDADVSASQQISLGDLIKPAKPHKRKAEDFEVIPKVRSVIALDDLAPTVPELDEPWEHVTLEDEHDLAPSYAQVVATAA
ncbi:hypothetical protein DAEQUDRAFT_722036 [Daedalea quercina L-15889]|uniref:Uncharacterized protein n=1 Tax=Daedalea quercina L-15889 TaxID=1314783 RepID=A0A165TGX3_9APHY|nr:hypothetical protein DAEQUDRAFT_722036 [Daedalea quercina L-15889]